MKWEYLGLFIMPLWWAVLFIGLSLLFRMNKRRTRDGAKRTFFYLLILVAFGFFSGMPLGLVVILVPAMVVLNFLPFLKGKAFVVAVVLTAALVSGGVIWQMLRLAGERDAFHPVVNARFSRDLSGWLDRLDRYAEEPLFQPQLTPREERDKRDGKDFFLPDYGAEDIVFERTERVVYGGVDLAVPVMRGFSLRVERSAGSVALVFSGPKDDTFFVALYGAGEAEKAVSGVRDSYARPEGYIRDLDVLRGLFSRPDYNTVYLSEGMVAQNSEDAIMASASISIYPAGTGESATFGYDLEVLAGAVDAGGEGVRILLLSAIHDIHINVTLPISWLKRFLAENASPRNEGRS